MITEQSQNNPLIISMAMGTTIVMDGLVGLVIISAKFNFSSKLKIFTRSRLTGASMNPTLSLASATVASIFGRGANAWSMHYIYWFGPLLGAVLAACLYKLADFSPLF
jgi:hypothetical protein